MEKLYLCILLVLFFCLKSQAETGNTSQIPPIGKNNTSPKNVCPHNRVGKNCQDGCHCFDSRNCQLESCTCADGWTTNGCNQECSVGKYGTNCKDTCHCAHNSKCDKRDGHCSDGKCKKGYKGYYCQTQCSVGKYGTNCKDTCHCAHNSKCDKRDGHCSDGKCKKGYMGYYCQTQCTAGKFGGNCLLTCHCADNSKCRNTDGWCSDRKCKNGYWGDYCQNVCPHNRIGWNCQDECHCFYSHNCHLESCTCADGWTTKGCNQECPTGTFGYYCRNTCHCADNSKCDKTNGRCQGVKCEKGYTGKSCQTKCPANRYGKDCKDGCHCNTPSSCKVERCYCGKGWTGSGCNQECPPGTYGYGCRGKCHCKDNSNCNKIDGSCHDSECEKGYTGETCETKCPSNRHGKGCKEECHCRYSLKCISVTCECADGWTGDGCYQECSPGTYGNRCSGECHCTDNSNCNKINGSCHDTGCEKGYMGEMCQKPCDNGTFGHACNLKCHCDKNSQCNHINGTCLDGKCADGYKGKNCQEVKFGLTLPLVLTAVLIIIISIVIGIVCYIWKLPKRIYCCYNQESENNIPMEGGHFQEPEGNESRGVDIECEDIYQNVVILTKDNLLDYIDQNKMEEDPFSSEFSRLLKNADYTCNVGKSPENRGKNRYQSILPYDHSRVILADDGMSTNYINANYIDDKRNYIATQGPLGATANDFWRMIWDNKCNTIVMLTNIIENGKVKCSSYWPDRNETEDYGPYKICCKQENCSRTHTHRVLTVTKCSTQEKRSVHHFHCTIWPDYGVIEDPKLFLEFRNAIHHSRFSQPPLVVHCSAGIGRTGTYIALDILLEHLWSKPTIDIFSCVNQLRHQRISMVQKLTQYQFIYNVLAEEISNAL